MAQHLDGSVLQLIAQIGGDHGAAGQNGDILQHFLAAVAKAGSLDSGHVQGAAQAVDDQGGQSLTLDILSHDQQLHAILHDLLQQRNQILNHADLLIGDQDGGIVQNSLHLIGIGDHIRGQVTAVKLHAFHDLVVGLSSGLVLLDGDDAVRGNFFHCLSDQAADLGITGRNGADAGDIVAVLHLLAVCLDGLNSLGNSLAHAAADIHGVCTGGDILHALGDHSLCQNGCSGGTVACCIVGLGGNFTHQLCAHVLKLVLQLDLLGNGHAIVGDDRGAKLFAQHHIAALGAQGDLDGVCQGINTGTQCLAGVLALLDLLCHNLSLLLKLHFSRNRGNRSVFHDGQDVALAHDGALLAIHLDLGAGILAGEHLVADLDGHFDFLAIHNAAGAHSDDLSHLGLLLGTAGQDQTALGGLLNFNSLNDNTVCKRNDLHNSCPPIILNLFETLLRPAGASCVLRSGLALLFSEC